MKTLVIHWLNRQLTQILLDLHLPFGEQLLIQLLQQVEYYLEDELEQIHFCDVLEAACLQVHIHNYNMIREILKLKDS